MSGPDHGELRARLAALEAENAALRARLSDGLGDADRGRWWRMAEGTGIALYELDLDTGEGPWSRTAFTILGLTPPDDLRGTFGMWSSALHPDDAERTIASHAAGAADGGPWHHQFRIRRADTGETRWLSAYAQFIPEGGRTISTGVAIDVTEQKRAETALAESEGRLRALTSNFPAGAIYQMTASPEGERRFLYVSESVEQFGGLTADELLGDASLAYQQLEPECIPRVLAAEAVSMRDRSVFDEEVRFRRRDGQLRWARIVSRPRAQPDGSWVWDGLQFDITEQKEAEQRLRDLNATLEERVAARAAELAEAHDALRQSQKLESMGQLTGGVAHDFNNLLSPIIGGLDLLQRRGVGDARAQRMIAGALQSAERAKTLVQRLLAFARRQPLQVRAVDLGTLVKGMRGLLESSLGPRVRLALTEAPGPIARGDPHQLELALLNLALNARDAMPSGGVLTVSADRRDGMAVLRVADTGQGMDADTLARAVEPFFSTKGIGKGTGLGLSMVHGLAAQLGGALHIESAPGEGTSVYLHLPLAQDAPGAADVAPAPAAVGHAGLVLLVDDEALVRASTADLLGEIGYEVVQAASAEAALARLRETPYPDVLVTDHLMPGMTGAELAAAVRAWRPDLPILIVSGYAEADGIAPDWPRLAKPFRREELEAALSAVRGPDRL